MYLLPDHPAIKGQVLAAVDYLPQCVPTGHHLAVVLHLSSGGILPVLSAYHMPPDHPWQGTFPVPYSHHHKGSIQKASTRLAGVLESMIFVHWKSRVAIKRAGLLDPHGHLLLYKGPAHPTSAHERLVMARHAAD